LQQGVESLAAQFAERLTNTSNTTNTNNNTNKHVLSTMISNLTFGPAA
jgi:hypothetical protein